jgi:hypothetical protein
LESTREYNIYKDVQNKIKEKRRNLAQIKEDNKYEQTINKEKTRSLLKRNKARFGKQTENKKLTKLQLNVAKKKVNEGQI